MLPTATSCVPRLCRQNRPLGVPSGGVARSGPRRNGQARRLVIVLLVIFILMPVICFSLHQREGSLIYSSRWSRRANSFQRILRILPRFAPSWGVGMVRARRDLLIAPLGSASGPISAAASCSHLRRARIQSVRRVSRLALCFCLFCVSLRGFSRSWGVGMLRAVV